MKNKETLTKKNLKERLAAVLVIYMDGLSPKKKATFEKYLDEKLNSTVAYYLGLLKKKKRKVLVLKPLPTLTGKQEDITEDQPGQN